MDLNPWQSTLMFVVATVVAVAGGLGTGITLGIWLARRELARVADVVDRMPGAPWFEEATRKLQGLDLGRLSAHYKRGHNHSTILHVHEGRLTRAEQRLDDHEARLRHAERGA